MFGGKKTTVINTTTVDNNIYIDNDMQSEVTVLAEFNPNIANTFNASIDTAPIAEAVGLIAAPIDRMSAAVKSAMDENARMAAASSEAQSFGMQAVAGGLKAVGAGLSALGESEAKPAEAGGLGELAGSMQSLTKIAAAVLTLAAVYFLFAKGRLPDIEVSA